MKSTGTGISGRSAGRENMARLEAAVIANPVARRAYEKRTVALVAASLIEHMRQDADLTQEQLAESLGARVQDVVGAESGTGKRALTLELLSRIAAACGKQLIIGFATKNEAKRLVEEVNRKGLGFLISL